jgi:predicted enzyme related to lactoylglutathione lyase
MAAGPAYFEIHVNEPERAIRFYEAAFGWTFSKANRQPVEYWIIDTGFGNGGMTRRPVDLLPPLAAINAFVCSMQTEDYDALEAKLLSLGARVIMPKFPVPGMCWQGYYSDPEGNTFGIFEIDEEAERA